MATKELRINGIPLGPLFGGTAANSPRGYSHPRRSGNGNFADGIDLNALWNSFAESIAIYNEAMDRPDSDLLTYPVNIPVEPVVQIGDTTFEEATELGVARVVLVCPSKCSRWVTTCVTTTSETPFRGCSWPTPMRDRSRLSTTRFCGPTSGLVFRKVHGSDCSTTGLVGPTSAARRTTCTRCTTVRVLRPRRFKNEHVRRHAQPLP
jgi:hypothetical protein